MMLHPDLIKSAQPLPYPGLPEREKARNRAIAVMQRVVLNDLQQGEPALCDAFAQFCADRFDEDTRYALCLSRITGEKAAQKLADGWVTEHVEKCRPLFVAEEVERRIVAAKFAALELPQ
ncbi:hypothetical protein ACIGFL_09445 [Pseudomonas sp. NPDC077649]|uniref:hypothetical protein n=1 Tax=Pseudomonas sp. NPDC077649 TaxID=3364423 RepID=UPI0037C593D8